MLTNMVLCNCLIVVLVILFVDVAKPQTTSDPYGTAIYDNAASDKYYESTGGTNGYHGSTRRWRFTTGYPFYGSTGNGRRWTTDDYGRYGTDDYRRTTRGFGRWTTNRYGTGGYDYGHGSTRRYGSYGSYGTTNRYGTGGYDYGHGSTRRYGSYGSYGTRDYHDRYVTRSPYGQTGEPRSEFTDSETGERKYIFSPNFIAKSAYSAIQSTIAFLKSMVSN